MADEPSPEIVVFAVEAAELGGVFVADVTEPLAFVDISLAFDVLLLRQLNRAIMDIDLP